MSDKIIDRDTYRSIKKMSREEMQNFLLRYADNLKNDSYMKEIDLSEIKNEIGQIKSIGEKRLGEIMNVIEKHLYVRNTKQNSTGKNKW